VSASGPLSERFRLGVTAADSWRDEITNAAEPRLGDIEGHHKRDGAVRLVWLPASGHQVDLQHRQGDEDRWAGVRERSGQRRWHVSMHDIQREHTSLGWQADWGGRADGSWQVRSQLRAYQSHVEVNNTRTLGVTALRPQTLDDRVVEGQALVAPAAGQLYTAGFEWRDEQLDNAGLPGGHGAVRHEAVFGQAEWQPLASLALTAGLRHDHHGRFGNQWSPRAYAVWKPAGLPAGWVVKGGVGRGFKAPTLKQISADYREDEGPFTYFGNAALKPERSRSMEAGIGWQGSEAGVQAMLFHNQVQNLIVPRFIGTVAGRGQYQFDNIDRARLQGLELEARRRWVVPGACTWQLDANYTYLDATDGHGTRLEKRPRHLLSVQLGWQQGPWQASLRAEHHAGQLITTTSTTQPLQALPDLTRLSAQVTRQLTQALSLSLGVDNLGNLRLADESPLFIWAEAPRTWRLALRGQF
jgi:outer membrane receptor for ferrienterochelin and colicins